MILHNYKTTIYRQGTLMCGRGGIGRRAALRSLWGKTRGSSSLLGRTNYFKLTHCNSFKFKPSGGIIVSHIQYTICRSGSYYTIIEVRILEDLVTKRRLILKDPNSELVDTTFAISIV